MLPWYGYWYPWGWGWHRRWWMPPFAWPSIPKEDEIAMLEEQAGILERELESIRKRLDELKKQEVNNA